MIFQHARFQVWNSNQHPYRHSLDDFMYSHDALPGVTNLQGAFDYLVAVLYPQEKPAVATVAALPAGGNTINDMRTVRDDGDGKAAAYRWEKREGEATASWHKIYDMDWGTDSILQGMLLKTQDIYVKQWGYDDLDAAGTPVAGLLAGQRIYGGATAGKNLSLFANSGDGVGAGTGYVQVGDNFRPTTDGTKSLGTASQRWLKSWALEAQIDTMNISGGSITDSLGAIDFGNENLSTSGTLKVGTLNFSSANIYDDNFTVAWSNTSFTGVGNIGAKSITATTNVSTLKTGSHIGLFTFSDDGFGQATLTATGGSVSLLGGDLLNVGSMFCDILSASSSADLGNIHVTGHTISSSSGQVIINPVTTLDIQKAMTTVDQTLTGTLAVTGQLNADNLRLDGNVLSSTNVNGSIDLSPNGTGVITASKTLQSNGDGSIALGTSTTRWLNLFLSGSIGDGTNTMTAANLVTLRNINVGVAAGMSLFYDGSKWVASAPDTEISHHTISDLTTFDDHTQYALLAGRSGGQTLVGGTLATQSLSLSSTANATKGFIVTDSVLKANGNGTLDLGVSGVSWRNLYLTGQLIGARLENVGALPSAGSAGRLVFLTTTKDVYLDNGVSMSKIDQNKHLSDTVWNGTDTTKTVTVSTDINDARAAVWAFHDNTNDFDRIYCSLKAISATQVTITVGSALPAGSYRLIGIE